LDPLNTRFSYWNDEAEMMNDELEESWLVTPVIHH